MDQHQYNIFDKLEAFDPAAAEKYAQEQKAKGDKLDFLIHKTFQQTESGRELLEIWKESLAMSPTADPGMDALEIGMKEGMKRFIRNIIVTIGRVQG